MDDEKTTSSAQRTSVISNLKTLLAHSGWTLRQTWATHPSLTAGLIAITFLQSVVPAGMALTARGLINTVVSVRDGRTGDNRTLFFWLALGLALTLIEAVSRISNNLFKRRLYDEINLKITSDILTHAASLDVESFEDPRLQDVMQRAQENTAGHFTSFVKNGLAAVMNVIQLVSLSAILIVIEPLIVLIIGLLGVPYLLFQWRVAKMRFLKEHSRTTKRRWTGYYVSRLTGQQTVPEVRLLGLAPLLINKFRALMTEFRNQDRNLYMHGFAGSLAFSVLSTLAFFGIFAWVAVRAIRGALTVGDVAVYAGVTSRLGRTVETMVYSITTTMEEALYISNLKEFLNLKPRTPIGSGVRPASARGEIAVKNVTFAYPGSSEAVLSDISFHIRPGETVALVGENGAGKTTMVKLIARIYEPHQGSILFDGIDLKELEVDYLRSQLSFVFQNFGIYEATAADNIAYGDWRKLMNNREEIERVARLADAHDMIEAMSDGYDTFLGRMFGEFNLSGGQWQKIAIARAFARDSSLLILDEPTSNLDARAEYELFSRFRELAKGRTTVLISHRFSTVSIADRILVMDGGRIIEEGTHQELLEQEGHYASFYRLHQSQRDIPHAR